MKKHGAITFWLMLLAVTTGCFQASTAFCQGTAFTYQGVLASSGGPATGFYDLEFSVFDAVTNGNLIAGPLTNTATPVNNGLFIVTLDFGSVFNGSNCWLQIGVRTNGAGAFTTLNPLQPLAPTPYAIYAANAGSAGALTGVLAGGGLSGAYSNAVALTNTANQLAGSFAGNGSGLTNLQAANLSGIVPPSSLGLDANSFTTNSSGQIIATNADLSVNLGTLPNLEKALRSNSPPSFLWFGDSTGAYLLASLQTWLQNYSSNHAVQLTSFCSAACPWWVSNSSPPAAFSDSRYYWYPYIMGVIGPGTNSIWGAGGGPLTYATGNQINVCMCASVTNGSAGIYTNTGNGWGFLGLLNEATLGKEGQLFITNFAVPLAGYQVKISGLSGNFPILGVGCIQTNCNIPIFYDMHAPGVTLQGWTNMGQSIGVILSNINPALVVEEQVKPISTYNDYTNFAWWMSNDAPNADVVLISSYADSTDGDGDVADYTYNLSLYERNVAITNHWPFVDVWTPMGSWSNIVANGFNLDTVVHLNARGQDFLSQIVIQKLNLPAIWQAAGLASVPTTFTGNLDVIGD